MTAGGGPAGPARRSARTAGEVWRIDEAALDRIEIGAGILGTGGGGNPYLGKLWVRELLRQGKTVQVVRPRDVPDDALVTSVGGMGAPVISVERLIQGHENLTALRTLETHIGREVTHLVPGEIGGANSTRPLGVAAQTGLPVRTPTAWVGPFPNRRWTPSPSTARRRPRRRWPSLGQRPSGMRTRHISRYRVDTRQA